MAHPERVTAIISQNGNAYEEGLSDGWNPIERYWRDPSDTNRQPLRKALTPKAIRRGEAEYSRGWVTGRPPMAVGDQVALHERPDWCVHDVCRSR
jgi:hypothetical protein